jgi:hypothetical protein
MPAASRSSREIAVQLDRDDRQRHRHPQCQLQDLRAERRGVAVDAEGDTGGDHHGDGERRRSDAHGSG